MNYLYKGNIKVAIIFLCMLLLIVSINRLFYALEYSYFYVNLDNIFYLKKGDKVFLSGVPIGFIDNISIKQSDGRSSARLKVLIKNSVKLAMDSEVRIKNSGIMNSYLDIEMGIEEEYISEGATIYSPYSGITIMKVLNFIK